MAKITDYSKIKKESKFSEFQTYSVVAINGNEIDLKNGEGQVVTLDKDYVENCLYSSDQFSSTEKRSKTEMFQILLSNPNTVFTASFQKQVKVEDLVKEIKEAYENSTPKEIDTKLKKAVKKGLERELS